MSGDDEGRPLGDFVARRCPEVPVGFLNKLLRKGFVLVGEEAGDGRTLVRAGQRVVLSLPPGAFLVAPNEGVRFKVVYEDGHLVVVDKPAGVVSEPGIGHKLDTLLNGLVARYGEMLDRLGPRYDYGMVHRLDRGTSGLLVVAKCGRIQRMLCAQFRERRVTKRYVALVAGWVAHDRGEIRLALGRSRRGGRMRGVTGGGGRRRAVTRYRVLERFDEATLMEASPETGRWRQIRLHFSALGHAVAGDAEEGDAGANAEYARRYGLRRMFLHAAHLRFRHPVSGRWAAFSSRLPGELERVLAVLRSGGKAGRREGEKVGR